MLLRRALWLVCPLLIACASAAEATSITVSWSTPDCGQVQETAPSSVSSADCATPGPTSGTYSGLAAAPGLDSFKLFVQYDLTTTDFGTINGPAFAGSITVNDSVVVTGGTGSGLLDFTFQVDGTMSASGFFASTFSVIAPATPSYLLAQWTACGATASSIVSTCVSNTSGTVSGTASVSIPFTYGVAVPLTWIFSAAVGTGLAGPFQTASGVADFYNTASLLPIIVRDSSGNQTYGGSVVSESGFNYQVASAPAAVPEPASAVLLALGFAGAAVYRLRSKRQSGPPAAQ